MERPLHAEVRNRKCGANEFRVLSKKEKRSRIANLRAHQKSVKATLEEYRAFPEARLAAENLLAALDEIERYGES